MKNIIRVLGVVALATLIGFSMTGCDGLLDGPGGTVTPGPDFPPGTPFITISSGDGTSTITRGEALLLTATVHNLDGVFETNTIWWTIVEYEYERGDWGWGWGEWMGSETETGIHSTTNYSANPYPEYHTALFWVGRYEARPALTVRARLAEFPALYATRTFTVVNGDHSGDG
ncbi:MAG: hypothetical protein FWC64_13135 [Treponema sp.]|nr:hypothetical protein [Treponema sp.]